MRFTILVTILQYSNTPIDDISMSDVNQIQFHRLYYRLYYRNQSIYYLGIP